MNTNFLELNQNKQLIFQIYQKYLFLAPSKKYIMIEKFKDELKDSKNMLNKIEELELLREQEINDMKMKQKKKLNKLDDEIKDILEKKDVDLTILRLKCKFFEKPYECNSVEKSRKVRTLAKERINEIKRLKEKTENNKDELLDHLLEEENKFSKLLIDLEYEKHDPLNDIASLKSKLIKLQI